MRVGINGFGRMGRLFLRAAWGQPDLEIVAVNEPHAEAATMALLVEHDSVQRRFGVNCEGDADGLTIGDRHIRYTRESSPSEIDWESAGVELVIECSGKFKSRATLEPHFARGRRPRARRTASPPSFACCTMRSVSSAASRRRSTIRRTRRS
jgi:glyceraldehyde 3-phosphate dehydrogenase